MLLKLSASSKSNQSYYENKLLGLSVGIQDSKNKVNKKLLGGCYQFITIIKGSVEIKNTLTNKIDKVDKGRSFVIPKEYDYQWQQNANLIAFNLIYQAPTESSSSSEKDEHIVFIDEKNEVPWQNTSDGFKKKVVYQNSNKKFTTGIWQGEHFKTGVIDFPYNEFILVKSGTLICTDEQGNTQIMNTDEALFVPQGTHCSWESQGKISLYFVQIKKT
jgi:uncharacterized cupin superfamily protein